MAKQIGRLVEWSVCCKVRLAADWEQLILEQEFAMKVRPIVGTVPNRHIDRLAREIHIMRFEGKANLDIRERLVEPPQSRKKPVDREILEHADAKRCLGLLLMDVDDGGREVSEGITEGWKKTLATLRQNDPTSFPSDELDAEILLKLANLMTDR